MTLPLLSALCSLLFASRSEMHTLKIKRTDFQVMPCVQPCG